MLTMTRQELRTAVAQGLQASPGLPNDQRTAVTEFAANAQYIATNFDGWEGDVHAQCPMAAIGAHDDKGVYPYDAWAFITGFDDALLRSGLAPASGSTMVHVIQVIG